MRSTKLLTIFLLLSLVPYGELWAQCSLITKNGSYQDPKTVCAPVDFTMNVWYKFLIPVDTSVVEIRFVWNDGTGGTTTVKGIWNAGRDSVWAESSHIYLPTNECSRTAESFLIFDGDICTSSGRQEQTFSTWGTDEENGGVLNTDPVVAYFCEGEEIVNVTFDDNSTFNCNIKIEPDNPNRYFRWVQFLYNTYTQGGVRIPNVTVEDSAGVTRQMTDNIGNFVNNLTGPIIRIPIPADGPNQTSYAISAPAGGIDGDIFEITLRNWNVCNPYDNIPTDGTPPADLLNGDNPPIETTARIEIIAPPPVVVSSLFEYCTSENILLNASAGIAEIRWYSDSLLTNLLHTGNTFNPQLPPLNLDNSLPGNYTFYVTSREGICESAPNKADLIIYQSPGVVNAGADQLVCADSVQLSANITTIGKGRWTTSGMATIVNDTLPDTWVRNLSFASNIFQWTVTNGICNSSDIVRITSDRTPDPAYAGPDNNFCDATIISLNASVPTLQGNGYWNVLQGGGYFSDSTLHDAQYSSPTIGMNRLVWRVSSRYGACPVSIDTVEYFVDLSAGYASAGVDYRVCEINSIMLNANAPINSGTGLWTVIGGSSSLADSSNPTTFANSLSNGNNRFVWTITSQYGLCPQSDDTINIIRDISPGVANAGTDKVFCLQNSDTLQGNSPATGNAYWQVIANPSGVPPTFNPNTSTPNAIFTVLPGNEGLYALRWNFENGSCISRDTVIIDFGVPTPPANAGPDSSICGLNIQLNGNPFSQGTGTWTQVSGPGIAVFNPNKYTSNALVTIPLGSEGIYVFEWRLTSGSCSPTNDLVEITFLASPAAPVTINSESCGPDSLILTANGPGGNTTVQWFNALTDIIPFHLGETYTTPLLTATKQYYVNSIDTITGCTSAKQNLWAIIHPLPNPPSLIGDTLCGPGLASFSGSFIAPATAIQWFIDETETSLIGAGSPFILSVIKDTIIWARAVDTLNNCLSEPDSIEVIVHPFVPEPGITNDSSCGPSDFSIFTTKSLNTNNIHWYISAINTAVIHIGDSMYLPMADTSRHYWVSEWNDSTGCFSSRVKISTIINPLPGLPVINDTSSCGASKFILHPSGDTNTSTFRWYNLPAGGAILTEADSFQTGFLSSNSQYWVSGYNNITLCEGSRQQVNVSINPIPFPISISGPTVVIKDQTGVIFAVNGMPGSTFYWIIPTGIIIAQNMNDFVRLSFPNTGSFNISVYEVTAGGCPGNPVSYPITVINDSISVDIGTYNQNACTGVSFEIKPYLFGGTPPYTYSWSGDIAYLSTTTSLFTTFLPPGTGTYNLFIDVADVNLRTTRDSVLITVYTSPTANILTKDQVVCVGETLQLLVQTTGYNAISHYWTGPVQNLSSFTIKEPVYTPHQPDTVEYFYQLTDINGCKAFDSTTLFSDIPLAYFEILTPPGCSPMLVSFDNKSERAIFNSWTFGDGNISMAIEPSHLFINTSSEIKYYPVSLEVTSILGCRDNFTQYAMVWPNPQASLDAIITQSCSPAHIMLYSTPANTRYYWDFGDGESMVTTSFNTSHTFVTHNFNDTVYSVRVITESSLNCIDSAYLNISVYANPDANFTIAPMIDTFPDRTFMLDNTTEGNRWAYNWVLGDGRRIDNLAEPGSIEYESPGNYSVTLISSSSHCVDSISKTIYLYPAPPMAKFAGADPGCMPHTVTLVNYSEYADSYVWEFGDGSISTAENPTYTYYEPGIYKIKLTVSGYGGEASFSDTTRVYVLPKSFFDLAPRYVYVNDEPVNYFNLADHADVFEWDFGDGTTSTDFNPKHIYKKEGTYDVTLKVWTVNDCFDLYVMENAVFVEPSGIVEFPNAFRPNSPIEENRTFKPGIIDHVDNYNLMIFNRWGELIFESFDQEKGWDGYYKGKPAKQDVYIWKVKGTYSDGKGFIKSGDVTLMY